MQAGRQPCRTQWALTATAVLRKYPVIRTCDPAVLRGSGPGRPPSDGPSLQRGRNAGCSRAGHRRWRPAMRTILRCRRPLRAATAIAAALALSALPGAAAAAGIAAVRAPAGPAGHPSRPPSHVSGVIHAVPQAGPARPIQPGGSVRATPGREFSLRKLAGKRPARRAGRPVAMAPHAARGTAPMITANYSGLDGGGPSDFIRNYGVSAASNGSVTMEIAGNAVTVYSSDGAQTCARISLGRLAGTSDPDGGK